MSYIEHDTYSNRIDEGGGVGSSFRQIGTKAKNLAKQSKDAAQRLSSTIVGKFKKDTSASAEASDTKVMAPADSTDNTKFDSEPLIAMFFFLLAFVYVMADFFNVFDINNYIGEWAGGAMKFAVGYSLAIFGIVFKIFLVLFFIYIFIVLYKVLVIALVRPILSDDVSSNSYVDSFNGAREIIEKAKVSFSESINYIMKSNMKTVFGIYKIPNAVIGLIVFLPVFVFLSAFSYYSSLSRKKNVKDEDVQDVLTTNYHYFAIIILVILILLVLNILYSALVM